MALYKEDILREFARASAPLGSAADGLAHSLRGALTEAGIPVFSFSQRVKSADSLRGKIARPDRTYRGLWDVTDLIGFRVVTAFEDAIDDVAKLIESRYSVDLANSRNRLQYDDHERFGYRSLHYVCRIPEPMRADSSWGEARFEIQVRTALQDAWAEIEHDLGYKGSDLAHSTLRRRFSRVSSLLEIADEELVAIRSELRRYLDGQRDHSRLDVVSIEELANHSDVERADLAIARRLGIVRGQAPFFPDYLLRALRIAEIATTEETLASLRSCERTIEAFAPIYFDFARTALGLDVAAMTETPRGYSLLLLAHARLFEGETLAVNRAKRFARFYEKLDYPTEPKKAQDVARSLVEHLDRAGL